MSTEYKSLTWRQMATFHSELRKKICNKVEERYKHLTISASEISLRHAQIANTWKERWTKPNRAASWDWVKLYHEYGARSAARRFDLALSKGENLITLCYGMMQQDRLILRLHAIERSPLSCNGLSGDTVDINLYAADLYAKLNNTKEIWLCNPVSPAHVRLYSSKGYKPHENYRGETTHLIMRL